MQLQKSGIRVLGISESFSNREKSLLCGIVMRRDLHIDGFTFGVITVGGDDGTNVIIQMIQELKRRDLNLIMLSGCIIAWYNIIDPGFIYLQTQVPVICVSYQESEGLDQHIRNHFPGNMQKLQKYQALGTRLPILLSNGLTLYARGWGITPQEVVRACKIFTHHGKIPEPLRVARLCARSAMSTIMH